MHACAHTYTHAHTHHERQHLAPAQLWRHSLDYYAPVPSGGGGGGGGPEKPARSNKLSQLSANQLLYELDQLSRLSRLGQLTADQETQLKALSGQHALTHPSAGPAHLSSLPLPSDEPMSWRLCGSIPLDCEARILMEPPPAPPPPPVVSSNPFRTVRTRGAPAHIHAHGISSPPSLPPSLPPLLTPLLPPTATHPGISPTPLAGSTCI